MSDEPETPSPTPVASTALAAPTAEQDPAEQPPAPPPQIVIQFQGVSQAVIAQVWSQLKTGPQLEGAAYVLGRSLVDHPHWFPFFEAIGVFEGDHVAYPGDVDPFLHVNLHFLIGLQVLNEAPAEARAFYVAREARGDSPHEIIHVMMEAFQRHIIWTALHGDPGGQIDMEAYADTLKALKPLKREHMWQRLGAQHPPRLHPEAAETF